MKTAFEEDEELALVEDRLQQRDRELTLSSTTLLGIFFGLVLLCGLFFGLGYTLGRRAPGENNPLEAAARPEPGPLTGLASSGRSKPSASAQNAVGGTGSGGTNETNVPAQSQEFPADTERITAKGTGGGINPEGSAPAFSAVSQPTPQPAAAEVLAPPSAAPSANAAGVMVQIAAVSNQADADVLLSALRKRGYSVLMRHEPTDALMHVQVGPFATRPEAAAMRQKLLGDGYNAILK